MSKGKITRVGDVSDEMLRRILTVHRRLAEELTDIKRDYKAKDSLERVNKGISRIELFLTEAKILSVVRDNYLMAKAVIEDRKSLCHSRETGNGSKGEPTKIIKIRD